MTWIGSELSCMRLVVAPVQGRFSGGAHRGNQNAKEWQNVYEMFLLLRQQPDTLDEIYPFTKRVGDCHQRTALDVTAADAGLPQNDSIIQE